MTEDSLKEVANKIFKTSQNEIDSAISKYSSGGTLPLPEIGESVNIRFVSSPKHIIHKNLPNKEAITVKCVIYGRERESDLQYDFWISATIYKGILAEFKKAKIHVDDDLKCIIRRIFTIAGREWSNAPKSRWKIDEITKRPIPPKTYSIALRTDLESKIIFEDKSENLDVSTNSTRYSAEKETDIIQHIRCSNCNKTFYIKDEDIDKIKNIRHYKYEKNVSCAGILKYIPICEDNNNIERTEKIIEDTFKPNRFQKDVFEFISDNIGNAVVEAVAGSGKTTTIEKSINYIPKDKEILFLAFNRHIKDSFVQRQKKESISPNVDISTVHSMGFRSIKTALGWTNTEDKVDVNKEITIFDNLMETEDYVDISEKLNELEQVILKLVSLYKYTLLEPNIYSVQYLIDRYSIGILEDQEIIMKIIKKIDEIRYLKVQDNSEKCPDEISYDNYNDINERFFEFICNIIKKILDICMTDTDIVSYDDMIWLPIVLNIYIPKYDFIFVDEAQDLNNAQIELISRASKYNGRIIFVGDRYQSIYGFRGADIEAIPNIIKKFDAIELPLSITYRCPKSHVKKAQQFVPDIEAAENAPDGEIKIIYEDEMIDIIRPKDMVICRLNAPLVGPAFHLLSKGVKVRIQGKDIIGGLLSIIKKLPADNMEDFIYKLDNWKKKEIDIAKKKKKNPEIIFDKYLTLKNLSYYCETIDKLKENINLIFSDDNEEIIFSTIHRAKGLEADRVFVLYPHLMPSRYATKDWEIQQEENIQYVAYTRSKMHMFIVRARENSGYCFDM